MRCHHFPLAQAKGGREGRQLRRRTARSRVPAGTATEIASAHLWNFDGGLFFIKSVICRRSPSSSPAQKMRKYRRVSERRREAIERTARREEDGCCLRPARSRGWIDCVSLKLANLEQIPQSRRRWTTARGGDGRTNRSKCEDSKFSLRGPSIEEGRREDLGLTE